MKRTLILVIAVAMLLTNVTAALAHDRSKRNTWRELNQVRRATAEYHSLQRALADGFGAFSLDPDNPDVPTCFDSDAGGMGVHYVKGIDDVVNPLEPEALVYEINARGGTRLVAVEYIVPEEFVENAAGEVVSLPSLFGHDFHKHSYLPVYILHAWIWKWNPAGTFADFNPRVRDCPS
ncbi:MAG: hypothetical protein ACR2N9_02370 [Acidimicrobiia bacterium]